MRVHLTIGPARRSLLAHCTALFVSFLLSFSVWAAPLQIRTEVSKVEENGGVELVLPTATMVAIGDKIRIELAPINEEQATIKTRWTVRGIKNGQILASPDGQPTDMPKVGYVAIINTLANQPMGHIPASITADADEDNQDQNNLDQSDPVEAVSEEGVQLSEPGQTVAEIMPDVVEPEANAEPLSAADMDDEDQQSGTEEPARELQDPATADNGMQEALAAIAPAEAGEADMPNPGTEPTDKASQVLATQDAPVAPDAPVEAEALVALDAPVETEAPVPSETPDTPEIPETSEVSAVSEAPEADSQETADLAGSIDVIEPDGSLATDSEAQTESEKPDETPQNTAMTVTEPVTGEAAAIEIGPVETTTVKEEEDASQEAAASGDQIASLAPTPSPQELQQTPSLQPDLPEPALPSVPAPGSEPTPESEPEGETEEGKEKQPDMVPAPDPAPVHECDTLAAHPFDQDAVAPGRDYALLNPGKVIEACQQAIDAFPAEARFYSQLTRGLHKEGKLQEAFEATKRGAELGSAHSMAYLGVMYQLGEPIPRDLPRSLVWFEKAAQAGNPGGMVFAAAMYRDGTGTKQNFDRAAELYQLASDLEIAEAMTFLAVFYDRGQGVEKDPDKAAAYLLRAVRAKDREARKLLFESSDALTAAARKAIQSILKQEGFYKGKIDGDFGSRTRRAINLYSQARR